MVDVSTGSTGGSITVTGGSITPSVTATSDTTQYWSNQSKMYAEQSEASAKKSEQTKEEVIAQKDVVIGEVTAEGNKQKEILETASQSYVDEAKNWANKLGDTVDGVEYSAKHYAELTANRAESAITDINTAKTQSLNEITTSKSEVLTDIQETGIDTRANISLSNLTPTGEKHFLGEHNISNNIKSAPQLVKWKLENGLLTLLTGSIATFAAGKEAPTLNIGDSFYGLEVVDISWDGTNLFYYCKTLQDYTWTFDTYTGPAQMFLQPDTSPVTIWGLQTDHVGSGTNPPTSGNYVYYNSNTNMCSHTEHGIQSFPLMEVFLKSGAGVTTIREVYQTGGKIGSTVWLNKNVSMNLMNTIDLQCGLNSVEHTTEHLYLETITNNQTTINANWFFAYDPNTNTKNIYLSSVNEYNVAENFIYNALSGNPAGTYNCCIGTNFAIINGDIISYSPRMPFRAADAQNLPGRITPQFKSLFTGITIASKKSYDISLADYLPHDGKIYEVWLNVTATTSANAGNSVNMYCGSLDIFGSNVCLFRQQTRANAGVNGGGSAIIPVAIQRIIRITNTGSNSAVGVSAIVNGFRRII